MSHFRFLEHQKLRFNLQKGFSFLRHPTGISVPILSVPIKQIPNMPLA